VSLSVTTPDLQVRRSSASVPIEGSLKRRITLRQSFEEALDVLVGILHFESVWIYKLERIVDRVGVAVPRLWVAKTADEFVGAQETAQRDLMAASVVIVARQLGSARNAGIDVALHCAKSNPLGRGRVRRELSTKWPILPQAGYSSCIDAGSYGAEVIRNE